MYDALCKLLKANAETNAHGVVPAMPKDEQQDHEDSLHKASGNPIYPLPQGVIEAKEALELKTPINAGQVLLHPKDFFRVFLSPESVFGRVFSQQNYFTALPEQTELSVWRSRKNSFLREIRYHVPEASFRHMSKGSSREKEPEAAEGGAMIPMREVQRCRYDMSTETFLQEIVLVEDIAPSKHYVAAELRLVAHANKSGGAAESCSDVHLSCDVVFNRVARPDGRVGPFSRKEMEALYKSYQGHFKRKYGRWIGGANKFLEKQQISSTNLTHVAEGATQQNPTLASTSLDAPVRRRRWTGPSLAFMSCVWLILVGIIVWNMTKLSRKMCHPKRGKWAASPSCEHFNTVDNYAATWVGPLFAVATAQLSHFSGHASSMLEMVQALTAWPDAAVPHNNTA